MAKAEREEQHASLFRGAVEYLMHLSYRSIYAVSSRSAVAVVWPLQPTPLICDSTCPLTFGDKFSNLMEERQRFTICSNTNEKTYVVDQR